MTPNTAILLFVLMFVCAGIAMGLLSALVLVWMFMRHEGYKGYRHYCLMGSLEAAAVIFALGFLGIEYFLTGSFTRWVLGFLVALLALAAFFNFKRANVLRPR